MNEGETDAWRCSEDPAAQSNQSHHSGSAKQCGTKVLRRKGGFIVLIAKLSLEKLRGRRMKEVGKWTDGKTDV